MHCLNSGYTTIRATLTGDIHLKLRRLVPVMTADHVLVFMENARLPLVGEFFLVFLFIFLFIALVLRIWSRRVIMLKIKVSRFRKLLLFVSNYISWIRIC